ncbi:hypothetical protein BDQ94DRAFT_177449 [Aspergillus welwitschiae]|uniref:Uncharacterized protein n=1 Tax=Aspergillus welwitschiae TaxID=1341132 RepID=A0A3F3PHX6_9EURO|nr:hypothetical protein BDQ94DRAFT_177449 [Aspergillus welwitschiae]RDH26561.1 hypothetical protein BDQ94DRAFT_177449 [Aspergillus welwitschiae]
METINRQRGDEKLPCEYEAMVVDCYLSSSYEDPEPLTWNGPSILSPRTHPEDISGYVCAMLSYPYTFESVAISPLFLPHVGCTLSNCRRLRSQIWEAICPYVRAIDRSDYRFQIFVRPRSEREPDATGKLGLFSGSNTINPRRILESGRFVENTACGY